jgi:DNA polymerase-3 subunit alpha (Gram-positive type)
MFYDYIFVSPPKTLAHQTNRNELTELNIKKIINKIIEVAKNVNKKVIAVSDAYYLDTWDAIAHTVYVHTKQLGGGSHRLYRYGDDNDVLPDLHLRNTREMLDEFAFLKDEQYINDLVVNNTYTFIDEIQNKIQPVRKGSYRPKIDDVSTRLKDLIRHNANELYGENIHEFIQQRINHELDMIVSNDYSVIYWVCHLLVKQTVEDGYIVGSRGSVGSSIVAYLAGISEVNPLKPHYYCKKCKNVDFNISNHADGFDLPIKTCPICGEPMIGDGHNIPFETFLGFKDDPKVPDIDLNFSGDYQTKAHNFIKDMFGATHTFRAGTISTVADKTAYGYTKSYYETTRPNDIIKTSTID